MENTKKNLVFYRGAYAFFDKVEKIKYNMP